jgi:hypothetical protein
MEVTGKLPAVLLLGKKQHAPFFLNQYKKQVSSWSQTIMSCFKIVITWKVTQHSGG